MTLQHRRWVWPLAAILAIGLVLRFWGITWGLYDANVSTRPHPDEWTVYWLFQWFNQTHSPGPCPSSGQCFFDWGMVFPYFTYVLHLAIVPIIGWLPFSFGPRADPQFIHTVLSSRVVEALVSTATVALVFDLGRRAYSTAAGLVAALLLAVSGLSIQLAHFATPDSTTVFLVALTLLAYRAMDSPSTRKYS